jgi:CubicO group peptidase (beta-lactamase class C family)
MVQDGKLRLEDTIEQYLPADLSLPEELRSITLVQVATHTAGLPRLPGNLDLSSTNAANPYIRYTSKELHDYLRRAKPDNSPGKKSSYSNLGAGLLGHILELRAGVPYEQLLRDARSRRERQCGCQLGFRSAGASGCAPLLRA